VWEEKAQAPGELEIEWKLSIDVSASIKPAGTHAMILVCVGMELGHSNEGFLYSMTRLFAFFSSSWFFTRFCILP
jgi:hypothetical protein